MNPVDTNTFHRKYRFAAATYQRFESSWVPFAARVLGGGCRNRADGAGRSAAQPNGAAEEVEQFGLAALKGERSKTGLRAPTGQGRTGRRAPTSPAIRCQLTEPALPRAFRRLRPLRAGRGPRSALTLAASCSDAADVASAVYERPVAGVGIRSLEGVRRGWEATK